MKKIFLFVLLLAGAGVFAQSAKENPPSPKKNYEPWELKLNLPKKAVPPAENPFNLPDLEPKPLPFFTPLSGTTPTVKITRGENGLPILFEGKTDASANVADPKAGALEYLASLHPVGIIEPLEEFIVKSAETDGLGNTHLRLEQVFQGVPVFGGEVIAHILDGEFALLNGRYYPTPQLETTTPALDAPGAIERVKQHIGTEKIKTGPATGALHVFKSEPFKAELVVYHHNSRLDNERLAWHVEARPNPLERLIFFVDAQSGEIIHHYDFTCKIAPAPAPATATATAPAPAPAPATATATAPAPAPAPATAPPPPVTGNGTDLLGTPRTFGAWLQSGTYYLEDASKSMFNPASTMPGDPIGVIVTLNALNTSPQNANFDYSLITSTSTTFSNPTAVSAHYNSIRSFDYYKNTFGRNSIDGVGGNILSFINVSDDDGTSMENAYWNGEAMWYGNGGSAFKPLARGLDVGGHEMTHGVIEKTANLVYQEESGALNESFADIFGAMIDRDDWKIGEDVMQPGVSPNGALRDLSNPHNGDLPNGTWWQPNHNDEKYTGSDDNGGVHINSGIPNHAYYLFASNGAVGKDKAEQVYYKALKDYLVKSSKFVDLRIAVLQAATELYGNGVANAAATAFDQVGIFGSSPGGDYLGQLAVNPGDDYVLCVTNNYQNLDFALGTGQVLTPSLYTQGIKSRPSITDDGSQIIFVNDAGHIIPIDMVYEPTIQFTVNQPISPTPIWRNAVISKDGRYIAALTESADNTIYVYDILTGLDETFVLYNPTYTTGQITGDVQYADVLEFDYSGNYIMYDAFNELTSTTGSDISYWDIGFLQFRENDAFADGNNAFISKLFNGLPEKTSIGDPTFAKNSPYIIAFDLIDELNDRYDIYGANVETGDYNIILQNNGSLGWPNYNRLDNALIYHGPDQNSQINIYKRPLAADKISPSGNESLFISNRQWGVWFADGNRSLMVGTTEPDIFAGISAAPNPATDAVRLSVESKIAAPARVSVVNMLGETVQSAEIQLTEGNNQYDLNIRNLPAGAYVIRLFTGAGGAAVKVLKQ